MGSIVGEVVGVIAPVLFCVLVGFSLALIKAPFDSKIVGSLVSKVGYPALLISHLAKQPVDLDAFAEVMLAALLTVASVGVIALVVLKALRLPPRAFITPMMLNNVGNVGLPVCALAFGGAGLSYGMAFVVVVLVGVFTIGIWIPMGRVTLRDIFQQPVIYAVVVSIFLMFTGLALPAPIARALDILGGLAIPLMLLTLGFTLASLKIGSIWRGCYLALCHLAIALPVALVVVQLFDLQGVARSVFILQCLMPVSVATYLWIERYTPDYAPDVAGMIMVSTISTVLVLPVALSYLN